MSAVFDCAILRISDGFSCAQHGINVCHFDDPYSPNCARGADATR